MKKTLYITISLLFCAFFVQAQYSSILRENINESDVPETVQQSQRFKFPDGFTTGWKYHTPLGAIQEDKTYYMASFKKDGRLGNYAFYSPDGVLLSYLIYVNAKNLPGAIQDEAKNQLSGSYIKSA